MYRLLRTLLAIVAGLLIVTFAIANRHWVPVYFTPLPASVEVPSFFIFLFGMIVGALIGGVASWLHAHRRRVETRRLRRTVEDYRYRDADRQRREDAAAARPRAPVGPALPAPAR